MLEARREAAAASMDVARIAAAADALFDDPNAGFLGSGEVVAVEFFDYQCGFCKRQLAAVKAFADAHPDKRVILKEFPILGPASEMAARAALAVRAVAGNDAYIAVHNGLLQHQGRLDQVSIDGVIIKAGLDLASIHAAMQDEAISRQIAANRQLAAELGSSHTRMGFPT